ncbi:hypothetical protein BGX26_000435 [Mortierella sp. AD094]|nr:hypothetical protein BGX26_000435 [Mortierella sp. AD094]
MATPVSSNYTSNFFLPPNGNITVPDMSAYDALVARLASDKANNPAVTLDDYYKDIINPVMAFMAAYVCEASNPDLSVIFSTDRCAQNDQYGTPTQSIVDILGGEYKPGLVKRRDIATPNKEQRYILGLLIDCWTLKSLSTSESSTPLSWQNCYELKQVMKKKYKQYQKLNPRIDNQNSHTMNNEFGAPSLNIQIQIGGVTYGALLIPVNIDLGVDVITTAMRSSLDSDQVISVQLTGQGSTTVTPSPGISSTFLNTAIATAVAILMGLGGSF